MSDGKRQDDTLELARSLRDDLRIGEADRAEVVRFEAGSVPVYGVGDAHVLKLFPSAERAFWETEKAALSAIGGRLSIPTPALLGAGARGDWLYVLMSRLRGVSLRDAWPAMDDATRERLLRQVGGGLAELHAVDVRGADSGPLGLDWSSFVQAQRASARERQIARRLEGRWADQIERFLERWAPLDDGRRALLHTEVMREHLLVEEVDGAWRLGGLVDFEPAMIGAPDYELSSIGVFVACGEPRWLRVVLEGYGRPLEEDLAMRVMAWALLHRYSNLRWYLERLPVPPDVTTLESLAVRWFG